MLWLRVYDAFLLKETRKIAQTIRSKFNFQVLQFIYFYFCKNLKQYLMPPKTYWLIFWEVRKSWVTKSSYEVDLHKMTSLFELQTQKFS